ncbi:MAG: twin-arginine translocase subunit TatB [Betaproteobacteria bacterium HGW-Betaproteobacteria-8]|nr:MAG: twin-arginine translocase subunit TatB [Betaproteobacteria bacterium HGW-Betaproteobacteria-8]
MFDIAFTELIIIAVVALLVIGPEKLPKVARTLGSLVGRMQRYVTTVKQDIERELQMDELRKLQQDVQQGTQTVKNEVENTIHSGLTEARQLTEDLAGQVKTVEVPDAKPEKTPDDQP